MENWTTVFLSESDIVLARVDGHIALSDGVVVRVDVAWWKVAGTLVDFSSRTTVVSVSLVPSWRAGTHDATVKAVTNA